MFFRRLLSFLLILLSIACFFVFAAFMAVRYWAEDCEVSQVFKHSRSIHLVGPNYMGTYDVAVTPLTAANKLAQMCQLVTVAPVPAFDVLDKKVWLIPFREFQFAYYETPGSHRLLLLLLVAGIALLVAAYVLFGEKEG